MFLNTNYRNLFDILFDLISYALFLRLSILTKNENMSIIHTLTHKTYLNV